jgi:hypothetical protein
MTSSKKADEKSDSKDKSAVHQWLAISVAALAAIAAWGSCSGAQRNADAATKNSEASTANLKLCF